MPLSTNVTLPKSHAAVFPNRCVACGKHDPDASYRAGTHAVGWWTFVLMTFGRRFTVQVPACGTCRGRMQRQRWGRLAINVVFVVAAVLIAGSLLKWYHGPFKPWLMMGVALVCMLPLVIWEIYFPQPIDMTAYTKTVDYEFRNEDYAHEFALLNYEAAQDL